MRRLLFLLAVAGVALTAVPAVLADTPLFATSGDNSGVVRGDTRYVLFHNTTTGTTLSAISTTDGNVLRQINISGGWYFPNTLGGAGGLSHDGKTLLLVDEIDKTRFARSTFLDIDPLRMKLVRSFTPYASIGRPRPQYVLTDALSPDGSRLYAVEYTNVDTGVASPCFSEYAYDLRSHESVSMRTDDYRKGAVGTAMGRAASADGRWVYTLYQKPSGASFIQVLDTVGADVHCVYLPASGGADLAGLSLGNDGRMLAVSSAGGGPRFDVAVGSWRISKAPAGPFPWVWLVAGVGGIALLSVGGLVLWRRRGKEVAEYAG